MRKVLFLIILSSSLLACKREVPLVERESMARLPNFVHSSMPDLANHVTTALNYYYPNLSSLLNNGTMTLNVTCFDEEMLHSIYSEYETTTNDTILYLVNFSEDRGFAIYNKDDGVIYISDKGHINLSDFGPNKTQEWIDANGPLFDLTTLIDMYALYRETYNKWIVIGDDDIDYRDSLIRKRYIINPPFEPLVRTHMHQYYPYNIYCTDSHGNSAVAGCIAIAVTQLFACNELPSTLNYRNWSEQCDWQSYVTACVNYDTQSGSVTSAMNDLAYRIHIIGEQCHTSYGASASSSTTLFAKNCISSYSCFSNVRIENLDFRNNAYLSQIEDGRPILITGTRSDNSCGHAWLLDGYSLACQDYLRIYDNGQTDTITKSWTEVHNNWGWGGTCDGYCSEIVFDPSDCINPTVNYIIQQISSNSNTNNIRYNIDNKIIMYNH